jgi:hypothetical protein
MTIENRTITAPIDMSLIRGAQELERTEQGVLPHRLPASARAQSNDPQLLMVEAQPSGVRIAGDGQRRASAGPGVHNKVRGPPGGR